MEVSVRALTVACSAACVFGSGAVQAQTRPVDPPGAPAAQDGATTIDEVIVTAQRRSERLQDVPVAVTVAKAEVLESLGITSVIDLRAVAPALNSSNANGYFASSIRGVGSFGISPGAESPVALYVDGVYYAASQASELSLNNIDGVEVLKGPQGTLFGRNATGGVVQITTRRPSEVPTGQFNLSYGNYETLVGTAYLSGGLAPQLAADFALSATTQGKGYGRNLITGGDALGIDHDVSLRSKLVWTPTDLTTLTLIASYWDGDDSRSASVTRPGSLSGYIPGRVAPDLGYDIEADTDTRSTGSTKGLSVSLEHDLDWATFKSISAYREAEMRYLKDIDFTPSSLFGLDQRQEDNQFTQEFQLTSAGESRLKWTAGLYYFQSEAGYTPLALDRTNINGTQLRLGGTQTAKSIAGYGQATYALTDSTNVTLGGRYTDETRDETDSYVDVTLVVPGINILTPFPDRSTDASKFTYRVSLDHRFSEQVLGYASYNTGFKSGGFNTSSPGALPYEAEELTAYEVGLKTDLLDRRLRVNGAAFYYDYSNIQVQKLTGTALTLINGAAARLYGLDLDFTAQVTNDFSLTGGVTLLSPEFEDFPGCPITPQAGGVPSTVGNCSGNQMPFASKVAGSLAGNYERRLGAGLLAASLSAYYTSGLYFEPDNVIEQGSYTKVSASLKWTSDRGYSLSAYGANLTDERTVAFAATQGTGNQTVAYAAPRTFGVTIGYAF